MIDETQFLPRRTSIVNSFRMAKGDIRGKLESRRVENVREHIITEAGVVDNTIVAELVNMGYLEPHHQLYGFLLMEMHRAYLSPLSYKLNGMQIFNGEISGDDAAKMYLEVVNDFRFDRVKIIETACATPAAFESLHVAAVANVYRECFETLVGMIDSARDRRKEMLANGEKSS